MVIIKEQMICNLFWTEEQAILRHTYPNRGTAPRGQPRFLSPKILKKIKESKTPTFCDKFCQTLADNLAAQPG